MSDSRFTSDKGLTTRTKMRVLQLTTILLLILVSVEARKRNVNCGKLQRKCDKGRENACRKIQKHCPSTVTVDPHREEALHVDTAMTPDRPGHIAVDASTTRLEVAWLPPSSAVPVEGYILGYGKNVPGIHVVTLGPDTFSYVINDVEPNSLYVISLKAFNSVGYGLSIYETAETRGEQVREPHEMTTAGNPLGGQMLWGGRGDPSNQGVDIAHVDEDDGGLRLDTDQFRRLAATDHPI